MAKTERMVLALINISRANGPSIARVGAGHRAMPGPLQRVTDRLPAADHVVRMCTIPKP
jgi:hypothetical protein